MAASATIGSAHAGLWRALFDPDRFAFLEGRTQRTSWHETPADPLPIRQPHGAAPARSLQILRMRVRGGGPAEARRLSFRALDIEQIGHVYEGLLDHTAKRATEPVLGLAGTQRPESRRLRSPSWSAGHTAPSPRRGLATLDMFGNGDQMPHCATTRLLNVAEEGADERAGERLSKPLRMARRLCAPPVTTTRRCYARVTAIRRLSARR